MPTLARDKAADALPGVISNIIDCRAIADVPQRVACYDAAADALAAATASKDLVVADRTETREARKALFGFTLPRLKLLGNADKSEEITSTTAPITQVSTTTGGLYVLTLEDGGRWAQKESVFINRPKPGETVTISKGAVGGYVAKIGTGRSFRVQRLAE